MTFGEIEARLARGACTTANDALFAARDRLFWACGSVSGVLMHLRSTEPDGLPSRDRLLRALLQQLATRSDAVWLEVLTLAFVPMLRRIERSVEDPPDDVVAQLLFAFVGATRVAANAAAKTLPIALRIRRDTERTFYRAIGRERAYQARHVPLADESDEGFEPLGPDMRRCDLERMVEQVTARADASFKAVVHTVAGIEGLRAYALRIRPTDAPSEHQRTYETLKRRRSRGLARLREPEAPGVPRARRAV